MVPRSLAKLEDEQEVGCTEYAHTFLSQQTSSRDSSEDTDVGVTDALANIKATSSGHACSLVEFPGESRLFMSTIYRVHQESVLIFKLKLSKGGCYVLVILTWMTDEIMEPLKNVKKIGIFNEDFLPASR
ncbi:uncharacterized protein ARMOST_01569 [Armillaria ostoyae]|uniref:Uncharacterized protein n=1 Tax=Armillaria ostoyae TaxID=47428 RepID=A0A284QP82_ARMOS|nr:uncharacterized protein ARMOST_01569 [Armillaria ostoyae]